MSRKYKNKFDFFVHTEPPSQTRREKSRVLCLYSKRKCARVFVCVGWPLCMWCRASNWIWFCFNQITISSVFVFAPEGTQEWEGEEPIQQYWLFIPKWTFNAILFGCGCEFGTFMEIKCQLPNLHILWGCMSVIDFLITMYDGSGYLAAPQVTPGTKWGKISNQFECISVSPSLIQINVIFTLSWPWHQGRSVIRDTIIGWRSLSLSFSLHIFLSQMSRTCIHSQCRYRSCCCKHKKIHD